MKRNTSVTRSRGPAAARPVNPTAAFVALLLALAVPRLLRLLYPQLWIEDEWYINGAFMMSHGLLPYRDFPLPHLPALELTMAGLFWLAPATIRTAELATACAAFAGSLLVFLLGRSLIDRPSGAAAAILFATSSLLFRYHVFEREVFVVVPVVAAVWLATSPAHPARPTRVAVSVGALLAAALTVKLTAVAALLGVALQLVVQGRRRCAAMVICTALGLILAASLALSLMFGADFIVQVFLFRAMHATFPSLSVKLDEMRLTTDIAFALGVAGVVLIAWTRESRRLAPLLLQLGCGFVFLVLVNPTYWAHTGIELLPWLSLSGGFLVAATARSVTRTKALVCGGLAGLLLLFVSPLRNLNWQAGDGSRYGFGYRDRSEIEGTALYVRAHSQSSDVVATPPIIAFQANRRELIPYPEIAGVVERMTASVRERGYIATLGDAGLRYGSFWDSVEASRVRVAARIATAVEQRVPAVIIDDTDDDLMPARFVDLTADRLRANGYRLESVSTHYEVWLRH